MRAKCFGASVRRKQDPDVLTGRGRHVWQRRACTAPKLIARGLTSGFAE